MGIAEENNPMKSGRGVETMPCWGGAGGEGGKEAKPPDKNFFFFLTYFEVIFSPSRGI